MCSYLKWISSIYGGQFPRGMSQTCFLPEMSLLENQFPAKSYKTGLTQTFDDFPSFPFTFESVLMTQTRYKTRINFKTNLLDESQMYPNTARIIAIYSNVSID